MNRYSLLLLLLLILPTCAEQLTVRNRIFKGPVSGSGDQLMVGLTALVEAVGARVEQQEGRWLVSRPQSSPEAPAGEATVFVEGQPVASSGDPVMVNLQQFAAAYGLQLKASGDTVDVAVLPKGAKPGAAAASGPDLIVNGQFTEGPPVGEVGLPVGSKAIPGWTVTLPGVWRGRGNGGYFVHLVGLSAIAQDVYTRPGQEYDLYVTFYGKQKPGNELEITAEGQKAVTAASGVDQRATMRFRATGSKVRIQFRGLYPQKGTHAVSLLSVRVAEVLPAP